MCFFAILIATSTQAQEYIAKNEGLALYRRRTLGFYDSFSREVSKTLCFCNRFGLSWPRRGPLDRRWGCIFSRKS